MSLSFYHEHPRFREAVQFINVGGQKMLVGNFTFQNEIGYSLLEIHNETKPELKVLIDIFPVKLDYKKDYWQLLNEVNEEIYNLAYHFIRKTFQQARLKLDGSPSRAEFFWLISVHFEQFIDAIDRIERQPHHRLESSYVKVRGDQLRKQNSRTRAYL